MDKFKNNNIFEKLVQLFLVLIAIFCLVGFFYAYKVHVDRERKNAKIDREHEAYRESLLQNNPSGLQKIFLDDVKNGVNDKYTKSDAYFITHRFFDNGGNIYELFDYVESHPELAFLKEAELIYPGIFKQIHEKKVPYSPSDRSMYAYLAYVEVLRKHGYTDIAAVGTMANQYAKLAYYIPIIAKEMSPKEAKNRSKYVKRDTEKALEFVAASRQDVNDILNGKKTSDDITPRDILVGMNQYAASLRYLVASKLPAASTTGFLTESDKVFVFTMDYAQRYVPELHLFTSLLNASTLATLDKTDPERIREALYPFLDLHVVGKPREKSIVAKVLDSKLETNWKNLQEADLDLYGKRNIVILATKVPEFKTWLKSNGWTDSDFK